MRWDPRWSFFSVDVELTTHCEQNCLMCGHAGIQRPKGMMSVETFTTIVSLLAPVNSRMVLSGLGNPLSHPHWRSFIEQYKEQKGQVGMVIHAATLSASTRRTLVDANPNFLEVSFPSLTPSVYEKLSPGSCYDESLIELERLLDDPRRRFPVTVSGIETAFNTGEKEPYSAFFLGLSSSGRMLRCHSRAGQVEKAPVTHRTSRSASQAVCGLFAMHSFISWDGKLLSCCHDLTGQTILGDVHVDSLELLTSRKAMRIKNGELFSLCATCDDSWSLIPVPTAPFPVTKKQRTKFLKSLAQAYPF